MSNQVTYYVCARVGWYQLPPSAYRKAAIYIGAGETLNMTNVSLTFTGSYDAAIYVDAHGHLNASYVTLNLT